MKYLLFALTLLSAPAFATGNHKCPDGYTGTYPNCVKPPVVTPDPKPSQTQTNNQNQGQAQGQGQGQGQAQTSSNRNSNRNNNAANATGGSSRSNATGGNATSGSLSGVSGSGNSRTNVDASSTNSLSNDSASVSGSDATAYSGANSGGNQFDASDHSVTNVQGSRTNVFVPGDLPANAMTIAPGAYITVAGDHECGVLQTKVQVPVYQWNKRGTKKTLVGYDEDLAPVFDSNGVQIDYQTVYTGNGGYYLRGSHVTYVLSTKGSSNSAQFGAQGYGSGGGGGLSFGSGRSYSEAGTKVIIRSCIAARVEAKPVVPKAAPRPVVRRKKAVRRPAPKCVERPATTCPALKQ